MKKMTQVMDEIENIYTYQRNVAFKLKLLIDYLDQYKIQTSDECSMLLDEIYDSLDNSVKDLHDGVSEISEILVFESKFKKEREEKDDKSESERIA